MSRSRRRLVLLVVATPVAGLIVLAMLYGDLFTLAELKARRDALQALIEARPVAFIAGFTLGFAVAAALAPGAAIFKVAAGALFGLWGGMGIALVATLLAATIGFLLSRYLARHWVEARFGARTAAINRGVEREGIVFLLALRLNPLIPFFLINFGMGLTRMRLAVFVAVSFIGLIPASFVYANAGTELARIETPGDILSVRLLGSLFLLSLMPLIGRAAAGWLRGRRAIADPPPEL